MPGFSLTSSESVLRVTPRASAACVMVKPDGSMHSCNTTRPGWGGFFMVMGPSPSLMVIDIINVLRAAVEAEGNPLVGANGHGPKTLHLAFERVQPEPRQVHVGNAWGGMKRRQNISQFADVFRVYAARVVMLEEPFQSLVADCPYHLS